MCTSGQKLSNKSNKLKTGEQEWNSIYLLQMSKPGAQNRFFNVIVLLQPTNNYYMIWMRPYVCHLGLKWLWSGFHTCKSIIDMVSQYCSGWVGRGIQPLASPQPLQHTHTQYQLQHHKCAFFAFFNWTWWTDGQIDKPTHQQTNGPTDRRTEGPTDAQTKPFMQCNNQVKKGPPQKTFPF